MINKGRSDSIEPEMGVISSTGLVGIVVGVSDNYAYVMSLLHHNSRISAQIKMNGQLVNVIWPGTNYLFGEVIDIPSHITLSKSDTIITSGNSLIFPEGINIGTVTTQSKSADKALGKAELRFATDFNSLHFVYAIRNLKLQEQQQLIDTVTNE